MGVDEAEEVPPVLPHAYIALLDREFRFTFSTAGFRRGRESRQSDHAVAPTLAIGSWMWAFAPEDIANVPASVGRDVLNAFGLGGDKPDDHAVTTDIPQGPRPTHLAPGAQILD